MDIEKIEKAFGLVLENIMAIQAELLTDFYDAFRRFRICVTDEGK